MEMDKYTRKSLEVVEKAKEKALEYDNQELTQMHLLAGLLEIDDSLIAKIFEKMGVNVTGAVNAVEDKLARLPKVSGGNLSCVDIVNCDVVLSEVTLYLVRDEVNQLLAVEDSVQQEETVLTQTTCYIVHVEISLYVASYEVRSIYLVCAVDRAVAETQVRAGETTRLLRVVREVCLAILVSIVTDDLN